MKLRLLGARLAKAQDGTVWCRVFDTWRCPFPSKLSDRDRIRIRRITGKSPEESYADFMELLLR